jgi:hypothetical protein
VRYVSPEEDSGRWDGFPFRDGDIVVSTRSKSGTTWMQMICALLVFQTPQLPAPLGELSPWFDRTTRPRDDVVAMLERQQHRRIVKTHTPLDGITIDSRATYIVVGRHPLDMAVSLYHQGNNIDRARLRQLTGQPEPAEPEAPRPPVHEWLVDWIERDLPPEKDLDGLRGVIWHLTGAWERRGEPNIILVHFDDLLGDLQGEMGRIARHLSVEVADDRWPALVDAARFESMRSQAAVLLPDRNGVLKDPLAFFRRGTSGAGAEVLSPAELARYRERVASMAPADFVSWLHQDSPVGSR